MKFGSDDTLSDWRIQDVPPNVEEMIEELVRRFEQDGDMLQSEINLIAMAALEVLGGDIYTDTYTIKGVAILGKIVVVLFNSATGHRGTIYGAGAFGYDDTDWNYFKGYVEGSVFAMIPE